MMLLRDLHSTECFHRRSASLFVLNVSLQAPSQKPLTWNSIKSTGTLRNVVPSYFFFSGTRGEVVAVTEEEVQAGWYVWHCGGKNQHLYSGNWQPQALQLPLSFDAKTTGSLSVCLRAATTNNTGEKCGFINSFSLKWSHPAFIFHFVPGGRAERHTEREVYEPISKQMMSLFYRLQWFLHSFAG